MASSLVYADRRQVFSTVLGVVTVAAYCIAFGYGMENWGYGAWGGLLIFPILVAVSIRFVNSATKRYDDPWLSRLLFWGLGLRAVGTLLRYAMSFWLYHGVADASGYDHKAARMAHHWWQAQFVTATGLKVPGSGFVVIVTAVLYFIIGPTIIGGYFVYAFMSFYGLWLCYRAARMAVPELDHRRYAKLIFLLPSLLFWPSEIGKEGWMVLCVGVAALGAAKIFVRRRGGLILLLLGLLGTAMERPHVTVLVVGGFAVGYLLRPRNRKAAFGPMFKIVGLVGIVGGGIVAIHHAASFFGVDNVSSQSVNGVIANAALHSSEGGSAFTPTQVSGPTSMVKALITVLYRPYIFEVHSGQMVLSALEGTFLIALTARSWRRLRRIPGLLVKRPYVALSVIYVLVFVAAFSSFGNFGLLARERVQVFPFFLLLLSLRPSPRDTDATPTTNDELTATGKALT